jgi:uncharacterized membrane protein
LVLLSHILGAIVAVGPAFTYGLWLGLARRFGPREEAFAFRGVLLIDSRLVTPAFAWQLISGLILVYGFDVARLSEPWLASSLVLYGVIFLLGLIVVGPRARRARLALEAEGPNGADYRSYRKTMRVLSPLISLGTLAIVVLMVIRPH